MELKNKKVIFIGDSITEGVGVADQSNRYDNRLQKLFGFEAYNYGISGTRLSYNSFPSDNPSFDLYFVGRAMKTVSDADLVIVYGGTNDYGHGTAPFGELRDRDATTYCGAINKLIGILKEMHQNGKILFLTPANRMDHASGAPCSPEHRPLVDYVDAMLAICQKQGVCVYDTFRELGIDFDDPDQRAAYGNDGLHFNDDGHAVLAQKLADVIRSL